MRILNRERYSNFNLMFSSYKKIEERFGKVQNTNRIHENSSIVELNKITFLCFFFFFLVLYTVA